MESACIFGYGVVGKATGLSLGITRYFDLQGSNITLEDAAKCRYIFICLPTPTGADGKQDTGYIEDYVRKISSFGGTQTFVIRSTVLPGTVRRIVGRTGVQSIVSNPEFLTESTWEQDARRPTLVVVGSDSGEARDGVAGLYESRWKGIAIYKTDSVTAETIKYGLNSFFATKVVFANSIFDLCQREKANYETVKKVLESHPWGSKNHFTIWHQGGRGAGGKCLKKDMEAFARFADDTFFPIVDSVNQELLKKYPKNG